MGTFKVSFSSFQLGWVCFGFFFFPLFSVFLSFRGKTKQFSLLGSPFPLQEGGPRGPRMLLVLRWQFGASSTQGWARPGPPGCGCRTGGSLTSCKVVLESHSRVFLCPSKGDHKRIPTKQGILTDPGVLPGDPRLGSGDTVAACARVPSVGVYRKRLCEEAPGSPARVSVSFQPWAP